MSGKEKSNRKRPRGKVVSFATHVAKMMHAFGDNPVPLPEAVALVESHAVTSAREILQALRKIAGRDSLKIKDFAVHMPISTHVYFRWRKLKAMSSTPKPSVKGAEEVEAGEKREELGDIEEDEDEEEEEDMEESDNEEEDGVDSRDAEGTQAEGTAIGGDGLSSPPAIPDKNDGDDDEPDELKALNTDDKEDDIEDSEQFKLLEAVADEEMRSGSTDEVGGPTSSSSSYFHLGLSSFSSSTSLSQAPTLCTPLINFLSRLAFANARSRLMTAAQYTHYCAAREAGFINKSRSRAFCTILPPPTHVLSRVVLEILSYLAYERVNCVVEAAARVALGLNKCVSSSSSSSCVDGGGDAGTSSSGLSSSDFGSSINSHRLPGMALVESVADVLNALLPLPDSNNPSDPRAPFSLTAYQSAVARVPYIPVELQHALKRAKQEADGLAMGDALQRAREAGKIGEAKDREEAAQMTAKWRSEGGDGGGTRVDVQGDAFLLSALQGIEAPRGVMGGVSKEGAAGGQGGQQQQKQSEQAPALEPPKRLAGLRVKRL